MKQEIQKPRSPKIQWNSSILPNHSDRFCEAAKQTIFAVADIFQGLTQGNVWVQIILIKAC